MQLTPYSPTAPAAGRSSVVDERYLPRESEMPELGTLYLSTYLHVDLQKVYRV